MNFTGEGFLKIKATYASNALPLSGVSVHVQSADEDSTDYNVQILTDNSGIAGPISLAAPSKIYSLASGAKERAFASYNVDVTKDGYYTKRIFDVPVFDGQSTTLPINMIPIAEFRDENGYPMNNLDTFINENVELE